jgi:peroxiredoxin
VIRPVHVVLLVALVLMGCRVEAPSASGEPAPDFALPRMGGGEVSLQDLQGKTVLLDFWATWCPPCVLEIPELNAFYETYRAQGVEVLAIAVDVEEAEELASWASEKGIQYPVAIGTLDVARLYGAEMFPMHVLVAPDGTILERLTPGYHDRDELAELLARHAQ